MGRDLDDVDVEVIHLRDKRAAIRKQWCAAHMACLPASDCDFCMTQSPRYSEYVRYGCDIATLLGLDE
jgi:hypothetical protein